ncbi:conserved domain protein [Sulfuriferula multivorans]|uniref:Conserved domain protein n=1 Tax=Sulfuriferula multivorans TaxID=1559896 RepID=A0A401JE47_9PROT|nr:DNA-binding domain-containing protein [Sulfuriferula multivorans]GBL45847.1 conserved domain protein [Sulfuriferula multivorans]
MSQLAALQRAFQTHILHANDAIQQAITGTPLAPATERLGIYSTAYRLRLLEALQTDYTALHAALGDEDFEQLCFAFIAAFPSTYPNLRWFGANMDAYLKATPPYLDIPVLAELASFEWAKGLTFDAADEDRLTIQDMAAIPGADWGRMTFQTHPSVQRLDFFSNAPLIWKAVAAAADPPQPSYTEEPLSWIIWRQNLSVYFRSLDKDEAWAIDSLLHGVNFAEICTGLCEWVDELHASQHAAGLLKGWLESGMIRSVHFKT